MEAQKGWPLHCIDMCSMCNEDCKRQLSTTVANVLRSGHKETETSRFPRATVH